MLADFHRFCEENQLCYFLSFGSALGAVRHGGFIPWDDDIDVDMHVDDIEKLISVWDERGDKETYFLQTKQTDKNVPEVFIRIRKNNTTALDEQYKHVPMHWGLSLDIFPVFNCPTRKLRIKEMDLLYSVARYASYLPYKAYRIPKVFHRIATAVCISSLKRMKHISDRSKDSPALYYPFSEGSTRIIPREVYFPHRRLPFGEYRLYGMNQVEKYLELQYGDYMTPPPEDQRGGHGSVVDLENDYSVYLANHE